MIMSMRRSNAATFGLGLLSTLGEHHRRQRKLLNPVFSIKHMRFMLPTFHRISRQASPLQATLYFLNSDVRGSLCLSAAGRCI